MTHAKRDLATPTRRYVLGVAAAVGGGMMVGFSWPAAKAQAQGPRTPPPPLTPSAYIRIGADGKVVLIMPKVEMGQGVYTSSALIMAEELDVPLAQVRVEHAPPNEKLYGIGLGQVTGASSSTRSTFMPLRQVGATTRAMLIAAAAADWGVEPSTCSTDAGFVIHPGSGRKLGYGGLADKAASLPIPAKAPLKDPKTFKLVGKPHKRIDAAGKVDGTAVYGIDVSVPGMKIAAIAQSPTFGGKLTSVDEAKAMAVKGVRQVVTLDDAAAVVADHYGAAKKGLAALNIQWDAGPNGAVSQAEIWSALETASQKPGATGRKEGDAEAAMAGAAQKVEAVYRQPFLAHAPMEPVNCTVHVQADRCELWLGTQAPAQVQATAAKVVGLPPEKVFVNNHLIGGSFGRRLEDDFARKAVQVAMKVKGPVKVVWSREEDIQHDMYRPAYVDRLAAGLDAQGMPVAWTHRITGSSVIARYLAPAFRNGLDIDAVDGAITLPYQFPNMLVDYVRQEPPGVPTAFWRGVGPTRNVFVVESFVDELAVAAKQDPAAYRKALLKSPRSKAVLDMAMQKSGWGSPLPPGSGRGLAMHESWTCHMAQVAEVEVKDGQVNVKRVVCVVDPGQMINPDTVTAQMQGGINFGLSAVLYGAVTIEKGRVEQSNFHDYRPIRMNEAPRIEVYLIATDNPPAGVGEAPTTGVMAAVTNAVFAATGKRVRELPLAKFDFSKA